jgi:Tol biopolymer transport system component
MNNTVIWILIIALVVGVIVAIIIPPPTPPVVLPPRNILPSWSPDGSKIAFTSDRDGNLEVYMLDVDTLEATRVTNNDAIDWNPSWSPSGDLISFVSNRDARAASGYDIYTVTEAGKRISRLTFRAQGADSNPAWTPIPEGGTSSKYIVFVSDRDGNLEIYRLAMADESVTRLTYREKNTDSSPSLSPDGTRIAFQSDVDGNWEIFIMDIDGKNVKRLTFNPADDRYPAWSPDGSKISFTSNRDGNQEIYVMDVGGKNKRNLTNTPSDDEHPTWSPDASMIAFQSDRGGTTEIWRMNSVDGTGQKQLSGLE